MLMDYYSYQANVIDYFVNCIKNDRLSHAFLVNCNNYNDYFPFIISLSKYILCPHHVTNDCKFSDSCNICRLIDNNSYDDLSIININGDSLKKDDVLDLKSEYNKTSINGNKRVYIINECEKINLQTANAILKFLEEPDIDLVAFLLTNNVNQIIPTIKSRCQYISLNQNKKIYETCIGNYAAILSISNNDMNSFIDNEDNKIFINSMYDFIKNLETNYKVCLLKSKDMWFNIVNDRTKLKNAIIFLLYFYVDVLRMNNNSSLVFCTDNMELVNYVSLMNDEDRLIKKIDKLINIKDLCVFNVNMNMFYDYIVLELSGLYD